jgi:hypothetical protein
MTITETPLTDRLSTAPPVEIDMALQALDARSAQATQALLCAVADVHYSLGERRTRRGWPTSDGQAVAALREHAINDTRPAHLALADPAGRVLDRLSSCGQALAAIEEEAAPLNAEYARRPWSRFFVVQGSGGHVHSSMRCSTCNNGKTRTQFVWTPELSGRSEEDTIVGLGDKANCLCTVCFPSAPVERTAGPAVDAGCPGSGKAPVADTTRQWGPYGKRFGKCTECGDTRLVTGAGVVGRHKAPKTAKKGS